LPMAHFARRLERKLQRRDAIEAVESEVAWQPSTEKRSFRGRTCPSVWELAGQVRLL